MVPSLKKLAFSPFFSALGLFVTPTSVSAHVNYVLSQNELEKSAGADFMFFLGVIRDPLNIILMVGTIIAVFVLWMFLRRNRLVFEIARRVGEKISSYQPFIPWMLRLSLGIAFIGAGTSSVLISPSVSVAQFPFLQILVGFLFLTGFLLTPAILTAIAIFFFALTKSFYLLGNLELFAALLALWIIKDPKPGIDDILGIPSLSPLARFKNWIPLILRFGIGGAMMFLAVWEKFLNPRLSELVVNKYHLTSVIPVSPEMWVLSAGAVEFLVGMLLFIGFQTRLVAAIAFMVLSFSFFYFGEVVYSHITLFGVLSVIFVMGGGDWSMDNFLLRLKGRMSTLIKRN